MKKKLFATIPVAALIAVLTMGSASSCTDTTDNRDDQLEQSQQKFDARTPPDVTGDAEYSNYIRAQEDVYDDPTTILWCTGAFPNATSPIFTVPIAGKLTSSSVSYYPNESVQYDANGGNVLLENQSVDGMYHGSPGPYRYGFTPGGQYVDFTGLAVFCTTALTEFQRVSLTTEVDTEADTATDKAEALLTEAQAARDSGDEATAVAKEAQAQALLDALAE